MAHFLQPLPQQSFHFLRLNWSLSLVTSGPLRDDVMAHAYRNRRSRKPVPGVGEVAGAGPATSVDITLRLWVGTDLAAPVPEGGRKLEEGV